MNEWAAKHSTIAAALLETAYSAALAGWADANGVRLSAGPHGLMPGQRGRDVDVRWEVVLRGWYGFSVPPPIAQFDLTKHTFLHGRGRYGDPCAHLGACCAGWLRARRMFARQAALDCRFRRRRRALPTLCRPGGRPPCRVLARKVHKDSC
mgnify:CR=1 FL=1